MIVDVHICIGDMYSVLLGTLRMLSLSLHTVLGNILSALYLFAEKEGID